MTNQKGQYTPGPWKIEPVCATGVPRFRITAGKSETWRVVAGPGDGGMSLENAHLIAAAPALLEAAVAFITLTDEGYWAGSVLVEKSLTNLRAAVAKAYPHGRIRGKNYRKDG